MLSQFKTWLSRVKRVRFLETQPLKVFWLPYIFGDNLGACKLKRAARRVGQLILGGVMKKELPPFIHLRMYSYRVCADGRKLQAFALAGRFHPLPPGPLRATHARRLRLRRLRSERQSQYTLGKVGFIRRRRGTDDIAILQPTRTPSLASKYLATRYRVGRWQGVTSRTYAHRHVLFAFETHLRLPEGHNYPWHHLQGGRRRRMGANYGLHGLRLGRRRHAQVMLRRTGFLQRLSHCLAL